MDRANPAVVDAPRDLTPRTTAATFRITELDVGTEAVRPGSMAVIEEERRMLLLAVKLALNRIRACNICIGAAQEYALETAIKTAEAGQA